MDSQDRISRDHGATAELSIQHNLHIWSIREESMSVAARSKQRVEWGVLCDQRPNILERVTAGSDL